MSPMIARIVQIMVASFRGVTVILPSTAPDKHGEAPSGYFA